MLFVNDGRALRVGWNEIRVHLLASGAQVIRIPIGGTQNREGDPVQRVDFNVLRARDLPLYGEVVGSLKRHGFDFQEGSGTFFSFTKGSTKASISAAALTPERVLEVELGFTCTPTSISDLPQWGSLGNSLADEFALSPMDYGSLTAFDHAEAAIKASGTWKEFSARYAWDC